MKISSIVYPLFIAFLLAGCGGDGDGGDTTTSPRPINEITSNKPVASSLTDLEIVQNYKPTTKSQEKCKQYILDAFKADKEIDDAQKAMSNLFNKTTTGDTSNLDSRYDIDRARNDAMNDYVDAALGIADTCQNTNSDIKRITDLIGQIAILRQRMLMGIE